MGQPSLELAAPELFRLFRRGLLLPLAFGFLPARLAGPLGDLLAAVLSIEGGVARARLDGTLRMKHPFYHKDDDNFVEATLVGLLEFEPARKKVRSLRLTTSKATYGRAPFGVVARSVP